MYTNSLPQGWELFPNVQDLTESLTVQGQKWRDVCTQLKVQYAWALQDKESTRMAEREVMERSLYAYMGMTYVLNGQMEKNTAKQRMGKWCSPGGHVLIRKKMKQNNNKTNKEWCLDLYDKFILTFWSESPSHFSNAITNTREFFLLLW